MIRKKPLLSVIIPTYNEERDIENNIKSLQKQSYRNFEIIVVDDGSTDNTLEVVKKFKKIKILEQKHKGPGLARNLGARKAKGKILILIDSDMTFHKDYLKNLIKPILKDKTGKIIGAEEELQIADNLDNIWARCWGKSVSDPKKTQRKIFRAIKKDKFFELGGFDARYGYADDQTFLFKYNLRPEIAKKAICYHKNPESLKETFKQSNWIGASLDNKLLKTHVVKYFVPVFLLLLSPLAIPLLSIKRCHKNKDFVIFPYMLVFVIARYFGLVNGIFRKVYLKKNVR